MPPRLGVSNKLPGAAARIDSSYPVRVAARAKPSEPQPKRGQWPYRLLRFAIALVLIFYSCILAAMFALRRINPPFTAVQAERRIASWFRRAPYHKRYVFVPLHRISPDFQHAVIAAEDSRFYQHHGFDWEEVRNAVEEEREDGRLRGASTLTQQLVRNLFLSTSRSFVRKGVEFTLVPPAEWILGKRRILELYLNVVEWGPGVYGAEAAAEYHYGIPASRVNRDEGARLAAVLPSPLRRKPTRMNEYSMLIQERMSRMGW
jgi:monofunctional biosynthetic peptidoglycan transglycosylase